MKQLEIQIRRHIGAAFIEFEAVRVALAELERAFLEFELLNRPVHMAILAETGLGKSRLLKHFADCHPPIQHEEFTEIPVLYVPVPARCTPGILAGEILFAMGSPFWERGTEQARTRQVVTLLRECRVRVVLLDEVNHLADRGAEKTHYAVADWIKQITGSARASFVLAGIPTFANLLEVNEQMRDRFRNKLWLTPFSVEDDDSLALATQAYQSFQLLLGDLPCVDLGDERLVRKLVMATGGRLRPLRDLLDAAVRESFKKKVPELGVPELFQAFLTAVFPGASDKRNPFSDKFDGYPLILSGEPFAPPGATGARPLAPKPRRRAHASASV